MPIVTTGVCVLCVRSWIMGLGVDFAEVLLVLEYDDLDVVEVDEDEFVDSRCPVETGEWEEYVYSFQAAAVLLRRLSLLPEFSV